MEIVSLFHAASREIDTESGREKESCLLPKTLRPGIDAREDVMVAICNGLWNIIVRYVV